MDVSRPPRARTPAWRKHWRICASEVLCGQEVLRRLPGPGPPRTPRVLGRDLRRHGLLDRGNWNAEVQPEAFLQAPKNSFSRREHMMVKTDGSVSFWSAPADVVQRFLRAPKSEGHVHLQQYFHLAPLPNRAPEHAWSCIRLLPNQASVYAVTLVLSVYT